jgi:hypothetical protein
VKVAAIVLLAGCRGLLGFEEPSLATPGDVAELPDVTLRDDAPVDTIADAPAFDVSQCPASYNITIPGLTSRYRAIVGLRTWPNHQETCAEDLPGKTHLIVFDTMSEVTLIQSGQARTSFLVGHFQLADQATADAGWFAITGEPVDATLWLAGQPNDNNAGAPVENNEQNRAFLNYTTGVGVQDSPADFPDDALCECDGKPIPPQIAAML